MHFHEQPHDGSTRMASLTAVLATLISLAPACLLAEDLPDPRYQTKPTVIIRVAEDVDNYLSPGEETERHRVQLQFAPFQLSRQECDWIANSQVTPNSFQSLTATTTAIELSASKHTEIAFTELVAMTQPAASLSPWMDAVIQPHWTETSANPLFAENTSSPSDWPIASGQFDTIDSQTTTRSATPILAATPAPSPTTALSTSLLFCVAIVVTPLAWLGWSEYQDLVAQPATRIISTNLRFVPDAIPIATSPCVTKQRFDMERQRNTEELAATSPTSTCTDSDYDLELGVLEDATAMLSAMSRIRDMPPQAKNNEAQGFGELLEKDTPQPSDNSTSRSDLTCIRGIGPATRNYLRDNDIHCVEDLQAADINQLQEILNRGGARFQSAEPSDWIKQASNMMALTG